MSPPSWLGGKAASKLQRSERSRQRGAVGSKFWTWRPWWSWPPCHPRLVQSDTCDSCRRVTASDAGPPCSTSTSMGPPPCLQFDQRGYLVRDCPHCAPGEGTQLLREWRANCGCDRGRTAGVGRSSRLRQRCLRRLTQRRRLAEAAGRCRAVTGSSSEADLRPRGRHLCCPYGGVKGRDVEGVGQVTHAARLGLLCGGVQPNSEVNGGAQ
ncbi:hypothetical protein PybrP1_006725 [[Pythium] brassicae (nom. inval.)]|nr:hypothetical protein PybrP1_006725 [[Pythium] brassicae (nom. inval.)]